MGKKKDIPSYNDIRNELQTFDIINCVPDGWLWGAIGHTAMVYVCRETGQIMVYESTQTGRKDGLSGVQLRPMREWVDKYPGTLYLRRVTFDGVHDDLLDAKARRWNAEKLCAAHIKKYRGTAYPNIKSPRGLIFLINAALDLPNLVRTSLEMKLKIKLQNPDVDFIMFCTMLVGHCFRFCGLCLDMLNPAELEPDDLRPHRWSNRENQRPMAKEFLECLAPGIHIGPEIEFKA